MPLNTTITVGANGDYTSGTGLTTPIDSLYLKYVVPFVDGTGAGQAKMRFESQGRVLAASATENLKLTATLLDAFGNVLNWSFVKAILVYAYPQNVNDVILGAAAANPLIGPFGATGTAAVRPGGLAVFVAPQVGWPVVAATADLFKIANGGAGSAVTYDVVLLGL